MPPTQDPFSGLSEEELIQLLSGLGGATGGGLPGKTPANRLNYYQDLISTLGFDPVQQAGLGPDAGAPVQPDYQPSVNKQRYIYESDPLYKQIFDLVDKGASPTSAVSAAGIKDATQAKTAEKIATDYAASVVDELNAKQKYDQGVTKKAQAYTAPDGSKYKNAPLGGNDIYGTASEYDLLGQPGIQDLLATIGAQRGTAFTNAGPQHRTADATYTTPGSPESSGRPVLFDSINNGQPNTTNAMWRPDSKAAVPGTSKSGNGPERSWDAPALQDPKSFIGGNTVTDAAYRNAAAGRIDKSQKTQVRSDANTNAMRRILALRTILGG